MRYLRTNTATIVTVGPFFDKTDGVTLETGLTITNEKISFVVDLNDGSAPTLVLDNVTGATSGTSNDLNYIANCDAALMQLELAAANVNYLGRAFLTITDAANHCPVFHEFTILPAMVYDSLIAGTDVLQADMTQILGTAVSTPATAGLLDVNAIQISGDATAANNAEAFFDGTGYAGTNNVIPTVTTLTGHTAQTGDAFARLGAPAGASVSADIAQVLSDIPVSVWEVELVEGTSAASYMRGSLALLDGIIEGGGETPYSLTADALAAVIGGDGDTLETLSDQLDGIPTVAEFEARTLVAADYTVVSDLGTVQTGDAFARLGAPAGASVSADVAAVKSDSGAIKTKTDFLPSVAAGAAGGVFIAGSNAATSIATALTANITGNLSGSVGSVTGNVGGNVVGSVASVANIAPTGTGLTAIPWNAAWDAEVQSEAQDAITASALATAAALDTVDNFLDTEIAAMKAVLDKLDTTLVQDGAVYDFTAAALAAAPSGGGSLTVEDIVDGVLDELLSEHTDVGSVGAGIAAAGSAGDPWSTALPGAYGAGTAGKMLSDAKTAIDTKSEPGDPMTIARRP